VSFEHLLLLRHPLDVCKLGVLELLSGARPRARASRASSRRLVSFDWPRSAHFSTRQHVLRRNVRRFRGGLVTKAHRLLYLSILGSKRRPRARASRAGSRRVSFDWPQTKSVASRETVHKDVLQKSIPAQIRQLILYYVKNTLTDFSGN